LTENREIIRKITGIDNVYGFYAPALLSEKQKLKMKRHYSAYCRKAEAGGFLRPVRVKTWQ
jgi:hypothetical protein